MQQELGKVQFSALSHSLPGIWAKSIYQFINLAIEGDRASVGHGLRSYTQGVQAVRCRHPHNPNQQIVFLDTPGFDDTSKSDVEVIMDITEWLNAT